MRGEYAKKGRRNYKVKQALSISSVCDETMALGIVSEVARMFSVDENSSSFFFFPALLPLPPHTRLFTQ